MKKKKHSRRRPLPLALVYQHRKAAPAVWIALCDMAREKASNFVTPTRAELAQRAGCNEKTVSACLTTLEGAGWITRQHQPVVENSQQTATLLRIFLRRDGQTTSPTAAERDESRSGRPTPFTKPGAVAGGQRPPARGRSEPEDSPTESRGATSPSPPLRSTDAGVAPINAIKLHRSSEDICIKSPADEEDTAGPPVPPAADDPDRTTSADDLADILALIGRDARAVRDTDEGGDV